MNKENLVISSIAAQPIFDLRDQIIIVVIADPSIKKVAEYVELIRAGGLVFEKTKKTLNNIRRVMAEVEIGNK